MITLKRLNVVRQVETEERASKLEALGFTRVNVEAGTGQDDKPPKGGKSSKGGKGKDGTPPDCKEGQDGGNNQQSGGDGSK